LLQMFSYSLCRPFVKCRTRFENLEFSFIRYPEILPRMRELEAPSRWPTGRRRYKTFHSTANRRRLPGEKAVRPA
jgi:hypothetical protein